MSAKLLPAIYLLAMLAAGWRLFGIGWSRGLRAGAAVMLICPVPLLFLLPGLFRPDRPFADMLVRIGLALLVCGALCMGGGWTGAWLRARRA
jgi:hypothetical protein